MKNKEIEELLNTFKELINTYSPDTEPFTIDYDYEIKYSALESLLSYIEQLEQCYCNRTDCSSRIKDSKKYDSLLQKYEQLEKENEFLKLDNPSANMKHFEMLKENKRKIDNLRYQNKQLKNKCESLLEDRKQLLNVVNILEKNRDKAIEILLGSYCTYDDVIKKLKGDSDE